MSLASIVSSVVKKESKVDRKKMAYFFRGFSQLKNQTFSVRILLSLLKPESVIILNTQREFDMTIGRTNVLEYLQGTISAILPDAKVNTVHGVMPEDNTANLVLDENSTVTKEELLLVDLGFYINECGDLFVYKGIHVPQGARFHVEEPTKESMDHFLTIDMDVILPTEGMFMIHELVTGSHYQGRPEIAIYHFMESGDKREIIKTITEITAALIQTNKRTDIDITFHDDDFKDWVHAEGSIKLFDKQHDYVLVLREGRIHVYLPDEDGKVMKEPNGWLFLN